MSKKKEENNTSSTPVPENPVVSISEKLLEAMLEIYSPYENCGSLELKTTQDIIEEMSPVADMESWHVQTALIQNGFQIKYTAAGAFWVLYKI